MTKKQRLAKLLKAAEDLQYDHRGYFALKRLQKFSCHAVYARLDGDRFQSKEKIAYDEAYDEAVAANLSSVDIRSEYTEQSQLARQLAVLMYREGIKRGKYE